MIALPAVLAALAVVLAVPAAAGLRRPVRRPPVLLLAPVLPLVLLGSPRSVVLGLVVLGVLAGGVRLVRRTRAVRAAASRRARVVELCEALQAELAAGQSAERALVRAAEEWPLVGPAARAAVTGGDVTTALRGLATEPGADALRVVAAAWSVAHRTGHGLAEALGRVAADLQAAEQTRRVVAGELASARATARLLAALPVVALAMGSGAGAAPLAFLLGTTPGLCCLVAGLALGYAGLAWVDLLARDIDRAA